MVNVEVVNEKVKEIINGMLVDILTKLLNEDGYLQRKAKLQ